MTYLDRIKGVVMKRRLSVIFLFIMLFSLSAFQAVFAEDDDIASGNYNGADWRITSEGELIIGDEGETQYLSYSSYNGDLPWDPYKAEVKTARFDGNVIAQNLVSVFSNCTNMTSVDLSGLNASQVVDMSGMFASCITLKELDLSGFDTSNAVAMNSLFSGCLSLTNLDLSGFKTSHVNSMNNMFSRCSSLTNLNLSGFDTSKVINMGSMFEECTSLTNLDLSDFDTGNATNMRSMFSNCTSLTSLDLSGFNTGKVTDMGGMFAVCNSLTELDLSGFNTSNVTTMAGMFSDCTSLTNLNLSGFNASNVTDMSWMFTRCSSLKSLNFSGFNTSNVTNMQFMFDGCSALTDLDLSGFDTRNVTSMDHLFYDCGSLSNLNLSGFDTINVTNMDSMFSYCSSLTNLDLSGFNTINVTKMGNLFDSCSALTNLDISGFDTSNTTAMNSMFRECSALTNLDLSGFDTRNVTDMYYMFQNCNSLTELVLSGFNTSNVTSMNFMFSGCRSLTNLDFSSFNTSQVTDMRYMFNGCSALANLDLSGFDMSNVTKASGILQDCSSLKTLKTPKNVTLDTNLPFTMYDSKGNEYTALPKNLTNSIDLYDAVPETPSDDIASGNLDGLDWRITSEGELIIGAEGETQYLDFYHINSPWKDYVNEVKTARFDGNVIGKNLDILFLDCQHMTSVDFTGLDTSNATSMNSMFSGCSSLTELDLSGFVTNKVTNMDYMFKGCSSLTALDLSGFNTSSVTDMRCMFNSCNALTNLDLSGFVTSNVTDMSYMFNGCRSLTALNLSGFNTSNVTYMMGMFTDCSSLVELKLSGFDTSKVTSMVQMFAGCSSLTELNLSGFDTSNVTDMFAMFSSCRALTALDLSNFDTSKVTSMAQMFYDCLALNSLNLSGFDTSSVTEMTSMFNGCNALAELDVSGFDTSKVASMYSMFFGCNSLTKLNLSGFNTSNVADISYMFCNCSALANLDLSGFNTSNVSSMISMFSGCSSLTTLDLSSFDMNNVVESIYMLQNCSSLKTLDAPKNVTLDTSLPFNMYDSGGTEYTNLPKNLTSSIKLYNEAPVAPAVEIVSKEFVESASLNGQPRETMYGEEFAAVVGDKVIVTLSDGNVVTFEYTDTGAGSIAWVPTSTNPLSETPEVAVSLNRTGKGGRIYDTHVGDVEYENLFVRYSGNVDGLSFSGAQPFRTKIVDCPYRVRVGDLVYHSGTDNNALVYAFSSVSNFDYAVELPDTISFSNGNTATSFVFAWFHDLPKLTAITLPENTTNIDGGCFINTGLTEITIPEACTIIGEHAVGYNMVGSDYIKVDGFTIRGYKGSAAETYANENGFTFVPIDDIPAVDIVKAEFTESPSLNGQPRETQYGETLAAVAGDKVTVTREDGSTVTFEYVIDGSGNGNWAASSTATLAETPTMNILYANERKGTSFYNTQVGYTEDLTVSFSGSIDGRHFNGSLSTKTKIVDCPFRVRIGDVVYQNDASQGVVLVYGDVDISDYAEPVILQDSVRFSDGTTMNAFRIESFRNLPNLTSVTLPENTVSIGYDCFLNTGLKEITIPESCQKIEAFAVGYVNRSTKVDGFTIRGYKDSAAETYANENGFTFVEIKDEPAPEPVSIVGASVTNIVTKTRTGRAITQSPVVKLNGVALKNGVDYTLSYKNNINASTSAYVTITGKGNYKGSITRKFTITPLVPALNLKSVSKGSKSFTARWPIAKKAVQKQFTGYQIQYSTDKTFATGTKVKSTTQRKAKQVVIRKLKKKKNYYVRIRRYLKWNGQLVYSNWSAVKKVKTK